MKSRAAIWLLAGILALPAFLAQRAVAQEEMGPEGEETEPKAAEEGREQPMLSQGFLGMLQEKLELKDDQKKAVQAAIEESREPLKKKLEEARDLQKKLREQQKKLRALTQDIREKIRASLDNEQKERFDDLMVQMRRPQKRERPPFGQQGPGMEEERKFPPERWEESPERGRRQMEEPADKQRP